MKEDTFHKQARRFAPWTAICILGLLAAMVFAVPSVVFAQLNVELSQDCETALVDNEHTITATVTNGGEPFADAILIFQIQGENSTAPFSVEETGPGTYEFTYTGDSLGDSETWLIVVGYPTITKLLTKWTADDHDPGLLSCMEPSSQTVDIGGRGKLNVNKKGAMRILICSDGELDLYSVDPETVTLAGVKPEHWKYKDRKFCPGGKDGFVDLVFKFKNKKIVEALEGVLARELADGEKVELDFAGSLDDGTALEGTYAVDIINKCKKVKKHKKEKMAKRH